MCISYDGENNLRILRGYHKIRKKRLHVISWYSVVINFIWILNIEWKIILHKG